MSLEMGFGHVSKPREPSDRPRFRMAILGDFTGRAAAGKIGSAKDIAGRRAIKLDVDTLDRVIEGFATTLRLKIGEGVLEVPLKTLDELEPDELFDNLDLFSELGGLKLQLRSGATAAHAERTLTTWAEQYGTPVRLPKAKSAGNAVPSTLRMSDFQRLIGEEPEAPEASPIEDLIAQIVGPHIKPDTDHDAMSAAVDGALTSAMRLVLHHPEFQSLEAQWRTLDLLARNIETNDSLELTLYDISAEEIGADLASVGDLSDSGLFQLLGENALDTGRGGFSAIIGLYTFEETPPHAELLGRIARVAAHIDAPFIAAIGARSLDLNPDDQSRLAKEAWVALKDVPEAAYLGLCSPRFLLRRPYGAKSDPCYAFPFEEFSMQAGTRAMLWANPAAFAAVMLAQSYTQNGEKMKLGSVLTLGDQPYHIVIDRYGDQIALPCTERNITAKKAKQTVARGYIPVVSIKGRDQIRLGGFGALSGGLLRGPWSDTPPPPPSATEPELPETFEEEAAPVATAKPTPKRDQMSVAAPEEGRYEIKTPPPPKEEAPEPDPEPAEPEPVASEPTPESEPEDDGLDDELDALLGSLDDETPPEAAPEHPDAAEEEDDDELNALLGSLDDDTPPTEEAEQAAEDDADDELDALLASFDEEDQDDPDDIDAELAALLDDL